MRVKVTGKPRTVHTLKNTEDERLDLVISQVTPTDDRPYDLHYELRHWSPARVVTVQLTPLDMIALLDKFLHSVGLVSIAANIKVPRRKGEQGESLDESSSK